MINHDYDYNQTNPTNFSVIYHLTVPSLFSLYEQPVSVEGLTLSKKKAADKTG